MKSRKFPALNKPTIISILLWSILIFLSLYLNTRDFEEHSIRLATNQASDYWDKDSAFRAWATRHGGVYVRPNERTPPNPLLSHLPHRDVETTDGTKLTLMNPAYMMRQMAQEFETLYGVKGSITGQMLLDPEGIRNRADPWELESLKKFDRGATEVTEVADIKGAPYLRLMRPMVMKEGCVLCHGHLGFKVGDIRGGVSVSVPLAPFEAANASSKNQAIVSYVIIWILGILAIFYIDFIKRVQIRKERRSLEMLNRSQKMDALGKLTGGVAHDFNNILGIIIGYSELMERALIDQPKLLRYARNIHDSGTRGAKLTNKLLSFSRTRTVEPEVLSISTLVLEQHHMLEKMLTARIELILDVVDDLWPILVDKGDLENAILNMSINAMHAMEPGGQLTIRTSNIHLNAIDARRIHMESGDYALLSITDSGHGMDDTTVAKIFEPFFSTKGEEGTGLGLSQVYGFSGRNGGAIKVYSEVDHGTQFNLYFPRYSEPAISDPSESTFNASNLKGNETILVVDDEAALLNLTTEILSEAGYRTLAAESGKQALQILEKHAVALILTDVIMPGMDGFELASIIQERFPTTKIQMVSGFSDQRHKNASDDTLHQKLLHKPIQSDLLLKRVRQQLDE